MNTRMTVTSTAYWSDVEG
uniref:Uncharacterized protein n=1 Tax=Romanomermis culicivorax TaxID=13658 RepID=A0A915ICV3_ROMCU